MTQITPDHSLVDLAQPVLADLRLLIQQAHTYVATTANSTQTLLYWRVGDRVRREVLGHACAEYGERIVSTLSTQLVQEYGMGGATWRAPSCATWSAFDWSWARASRLSQDCSDDERVRFFFKLPSRFKIPTPLGNYNPDWAVVFEGDARVYFVAETKSSTIEKDRRHDENLKIACGRKYFALSKDVVFRGVVELGGLAA